MRDPLFGTAVAGRRPFAIDRAHLRRLSQSGLLSGKKGAVLIHNPAGTIIAGWVRVAANNSSAGPKVLAAPAADKSFQKISSIQIAGSPNGAMRSIV